MKRFLIAAITCLALTVGVGTATAGGGLGSVVPTVTQVTQGNTNTSGDATASNGNQTGQSNGQSQTGTGGGATSGDATAGGSGDATSGNADGGDVTQSQTGSNENTTEQNATATSQAKQVAPVNANVPICVALHCSSGDVEQSNGNTSGDATASNENATTQSNTQSQTGSGGSATSGDATTGNSGCCRGGSGDATSGNAEGGDVEQTQHASNANETSQQAEARSKATQVAPVNLNVPVCLAKSCQSGDVHQSNENASGDARAENANGTTQSNTQSQTGSGGSATSGDATTGNSGCCKGGSGDATSGNAEGGDVAQTQHASNANRTQQEASARSKATQVAPVNANVPICIAFHCKSGDVHQSNRNTSGNARASNENRTHQSNDQRQQGTGGTAESGDATARGGCCDRTWDEKPRCEKQSSWKGKGKGKGENGCGPKPEPKPCGCDRKGGNATTGDAYGGDVHQTQNASNANETGQRAKAKSVAKQDGPTNLNLDWAWKGKGGWKGCQVC